MPEILLEAGLGGYLTILVAALGVAFAVAGAMAAPRRAVLLAGFVLACGTTALVIGSTNSFHMRSELLRAIAHVSPADRATIQAAAESQTAAASRLGLFTGLPVQALGVALILLQFSKTRAAS